MPHAGCLSALLLSTLQTPSAADLALTESGQGLLVFPEFVRLLLDLLKACPEHSLAVAVMSEFRRMLSQRNMEILWEWPWLEWFSAFLQERRYVRTMRFCW